MPETPEFCPRCGEESNKTGTRKYVNGTYQMRRCPKCGHQYKGELYIEPKIKDLAKNVKIISDLALKLSDGDPVQAQRLLDTTAFMHRRGELIKAHGG